MKSREWLESAVSLESDTTPLAGGDAVASPPKTIEVIVYPAKIKGRNSSPAIAIEDVRVASSRQKELRSTSFSRSHPNRPAKIRKAKPSIL